MGTQKTLFLTVYSIAAAEEKSHWIIHDEQTINPLVPNAHESVRIAKISILKLEWITQKMSYECRDYESVDEKSLS